MQNAESLYNLYCQNPLNEREKADLLQNKSKLIESGAFEKELEFGTGGVREIVGHGTNRLNRFNLARLNMAFVETLSGSGWKKNATPLVIIAYDSRLSSTEFAHQTYRNLKKAGFAVKIFKRPTPTPVLSFAVRHLKADAGIVLTASHNPPEYNGYKLYDNEGGQIVSPLDSEVVKNYRAISYEKIDRDLYEYSEPDREDLLEDEIAGAFCAALENEPFTGKHEKNLSILYSPLHGTGGWIFKKVFSHLGFKNFHILGIQEDPDGKFPSVKSPNPEEASAFDLLIRTAQKEGSKFDILLATDPDADRVGVAVKAGENYQLLSGNQICALLFDFMIQKKKDLLKRPFLCKTIVTSDLLNNMAASHGVKTAEVLTGFKNIAAVLKEDPENYIFGGEESFGYLPVNWIRDKDSISSAVALCELAEKEDLVQKLKDLYIQHGFYHESALSVKLKNGLQEKDEIIKKLDNPEKFISEIAPQRQLSDILDLRPGKPEPAGAYLKELKRNLPAADVVKFYFKPEASLTIRPSGTEPKIKAYLSLRHPQKAGPENWEHLQKELADEALKWHEGLTDALKIN